MPLDKQIKVYNELRETVIRYYLDIRRQAKKIPKEEVEEKKDGEAEEGDDGEEKDKQEKEKEKQE